MIDFAVVIETLRSCQNVSDHDKFYKPIDYVTSANNILLRN